ncbi:MAG: hypothetical protein [Caudoviricetes sp.]|nr:MAG: hypothetical protein [Caudoviricetes sp.]
MSLLTKALFVATVINPGGNATTSTEIGLIVPLEDCRAVMNTYMRRFDEITDVRDMGSKITFEEEIVGMNNRIKLTCNRIEE